MTGQRISTSVNCQAPAAALIFFPGTARTRFVPPNLAWTALRFGSVCACCHAPSMWPEVPVGAQYPGRHLHNDLFPLLRSNRPWPQFRIFIVLVVKHQHRKHASGLFLIDKKFCPSRAAHIYTAHEPARPVVAPANAIVVLEQH